MKLPGYTHDRAFFNSSGRCTQLVGNTVDLETATWSNSIRAVQLSAVWTDPDFDPGQSLLAQGCPCGKILEQQINIL